MKHLLVEGPVGCGKSTTILRCLVDKLGQAGGFGTVRVYEGEFWRGFCQYPAARLAKTGLCGAYQPGEPGQIILLENDPDGSTVRTKNPKVFQEFTLKTLKEPWGRSFLSSCSVAASQDTEPPAFLLLDEIGGFEVMDPDIREGILAPFSGDIPCIGVLKARKNAWETSDHLQLDLEYKASYEQFRKGLEEHPEVEILSVTRESLPELEKKVKAWRTSMFQANRIQKKEAANVGIV